MEDKYIMSLTMGDWSRDGHGISDTIVFSSNQRKHRVMSAYNKSKEKTGFDFMKEVPINFPVEKLRELGYSEDGLRPGGVDGLDHFLDLFQWFCNLSNPNIKFEELPIKDLNDEFGNIGYKFYY